MVDELLDEVGHSCKVVTYAVDLIIIVRGSYLDTLMEIAQRILLLEQTWCAKVGLSSNSKETDVKVQRTATKQQNQIHWSYNRQQVFLEITHEVEVQKAHYLHLGNG